LFQKLSFEKFRRSGLETDIFIVRKSVNINRRYC